MKPTILTITAIACMYVIAFLNKFYPYEWWSGPTFFIVGIILTSVIVILFYNIYEYSVDFAALRSTKLMVRSHVEDRRKRILSEFLKDKYICIDDPVDGFFINLQQELKEEESES